MNINWYHLIFKIILLFSSYGGTATSRKYHKKTKSSSSSPSSYFYGACRSMQLKASHFHILLGKSKRRRIVGRYRCRWEDNIKVVLNMVQGCGVNCSGLRFGIKGDLQ